MYILRSLATLLVGACLLTSSHAHSEERHPLTYISRVENALLNTPSNRVHARSNFDLLFDLHGGEQRIKLTLAPNHGVIQDGASIQYLHPDGSRKSLEVFDRAEYKVFKGNTWIQDHVGSGWTNVGWARITVHQDGKKPIFEGAFRLNGDHHHVQTRTHFMQTRHSMDPVLEEADEEYLVLWRDSDIGLGMTKDAEGNLHQELKRSDGEPSCSSDSLGFNTQLDHPVYRAMKRDEPFWGSMSTKSIFKRQTDGQTFGNSAGINLIPNIGSTAGCFSTRKVALVGMATDCTYTASFNSTEALRRNVISVINTASVQYEDSFNITLGLKNLTISDPNCPGTPQQSTPWNVPCTSNVDIQARLNLFSAWRGQQIDSNAYWTLLSTCGSGSAVGLAWLGQVCVQASQVASSPAGNETVSGANVVVRTSQEWQVVAHETGHTFGAVHDCNAQTCQQQDTVSSQQCCPFKSATECDAGGRFIMNPSTGPNIQTFSPCTIGNICTAIGRNSVKTNCLSQNKDVQTITGSQCGNGIVEQGEDCDCGGEGSCGNNSCCDAKTCKFKQGAVCDPSNEDCCNTQCQFASNGTVCRGSTGVCDPQETCSGTAATCPSDATAPDGQSCGGSLSCSSGQCTSRDLQCKSIMGIYTTGNDTYACSDAGCQISCASPEFGSNICYSMQQNFLDGTACQGGGRCANGACKGASVSKEISSWISNNKTLVIGLASAIGGVFLLSIIYCCWSRLSRKKRMKAAKAARRPPPQGWNGMGHDWRRTPPPPPAFAQPMRGDGRSYGGSQNQNQNHGQLNGAWENGRWNPSPSMPQPVWQPSVRYA